MRMASIAPKVAVLRMAEAGGAVVGVIAFDVYGTVVDPTGIVAQLSKAFGARGKEAAQLWRDKQLEFTFRRALMRTYVDFDACTAQALHCVSAQLGAKLDADEQRALLDSYLHLPIFPDVQTSLKALCGAGHTIVALTNGTEQSVRRLLQHAGLGEYFAMILSADTIKTYKPDPAVYALVQQATGVPKDNAWLVSGNPFDVIGAKAYGLKAAWVQRDPSRFFDPWEFSPDLVVRSLEELCDPLALGQVV